MQATEPIPPGRTKESKRRRIQGYPSTLIAQGLILGFGTATGVLAARMLGPVGRGEYAAIFLWPLSISFLTSFGLNQAVAFNVARRTFTLSEVSTAAAVIGIFQCTLSIAVGLAVVQFALAKYSLTVRNLADLMVLCTPTVILGGYAGNLFQGQQDILRYNLLRVLPQIVYLTGLILLFLAHRGSLRFVIYSLMTGYIVTFVLGLLMVWRSLRPQWEWNPQAAFSLLNYGYRMVAANLTTQVNQRLDQLVLTTLVPPSQLGIYAVAVTLSTTVTVFSVAAGVVTFSKGSGQDSKGAKATISHSFRASLIWLLISCGVLYALTPILIHVVFGAGFEGSILACRILLPGALMIGLNQVLYNGANALGRPGLSSIAEGISMIVTVGGLYLLAPRYGYIGAAIVSSVAYTVSFLLMLVIAHRLLRLSLRSLFFMGPIRWRQTADVIDLTS